jgi:hypothetical protein
MSVCVLIVALQLAVLLSQPGATGTQPHRLAARRYPMGLAVL